MAPLECWYDAEESGIPWKFGGGDWVSDPVEYMDASHRQSSWIATSDGRKRFHRDLHSKASSVILPSEQVENMAGGPPLQDLLPPLTGGWNDQTLADALHVSSSQPSEVKDHHLQNLTRLQDMDAVITDHPSKMYTENYVSKFTSRLLFTDDKSNGGNISRTPEVASGFDLVNGWNPGRSITHYPNDKVLRNRKVLFSAETSNANGPNLWSTQFSALSRDSGGSLPSAKSVSSEGRQSEVEVKTEQNSLGATPNIIPYRNGHTQGISSIGGQGVQAVEINRRKAIHAQSKLSELNGQSGCFDNKSTFLPSIKFLEDTGQTSKLLPEAAMLVTGTQKMPFHDGKGLSNFAGRNVGTLSPPPTVSASAVQPEQLSSAVPTASPLSMLSQANKCNVLGGSSHSPQVPCPPLRLTPPLQHPPQPKVQVIGVKQSLTVSTEDLNRSSTSPAFQGNLQDKLIGGPGRMQQLQNSSWQQVMNSLERDAVYKQPHLSLPQGSPLDMDIHGVGSDVSGSVPDWTSSEALVIEQLQATMLQLDVGTRMCIRDALYRLARSAKERRSCSSDYFNQDLAEPDSATMTSCITGEGLFDASRCESETRTNYLDRSIASLLFNTGAFRKYSQPAPYIVRSVSQPLPGVQNGPCLWSSTGMMGHNWSSSPCDHAEPLEGAPKIPLGNSLNSTWAGSASVNGFRAPNPTVIDSRFDDGNFMPTYKSGSDNCQLLGTQADTLNMPLSSSMRSSALVSGQGAFNFDRAAPPQSTMVLEGMRPEGSTRGHEKIQVDLDIDRTSAVGTSLVNTNYQSAFMPYKEDVGHEIAAHAPSLQQKIRVVNGFYDGAGNFETKFPLAAKNGCYMFGGDMDSVTTSHNTDPCGKHTLGIQELWHDP